jgi:hypothetical protein
MKKVIFSAIAMIAFVGSSMANTSEIKIIEKSSDPKLTKKQCDDAYAASINYYRNNGATMAQATAYAQAGRDACYKDNGINKVTSIEP